MYVCEAEAHVVHVHTFTVSESVLGTSTFPVLVRVPKIYLVLRITVYFRAHLTVYMYLIPSKSSSATYMYTYV